MKYRLNVTQWTITGSVRRGADSAGQDIAGQDNDGQKRKNWKMTEEADTLVQNVLYCHLYSGNDRHK